jgi:Tfp pilus assembly protein PilN
MNAQQLTLDFAAQRPGATSSARWVLALGAMAVAGVVLLWADAMHQRRALASQLAQVEQSQAAASPAPRTAPAESKDLARERMIRDTTRGLHTPWSDLLSALEAAPTDAVALLSIEPSAAKRSVRLSAEGRDAKAMLAYLAALQRDARLTQVFLVSHQVQLQSPGAPVRFQIQALWTDAL